MIQLDEHSLTASKKRMKKIQQNNICNTFLSENFRIKVYYQIYYQQYVVKKFVKLKYFFLFFLKSKNRQLILKKIRLFLSLII